MKATAVVLVLATMISCGENKGNSVNSSASGLSSSLSDGKLITKFSNSSVTQCPLEDIESNTLDYSIQDRAYGKNMNIEIPSVLSRKITANLQKKGLVEKITPSTFWKVLDSNLKRELNEALVESDITRAYLDFVRLQKIVAFAYTVYIEKPTYNEGYRIQTKNGASAIVAFTEYTKAVRNISPCDEFNIDDIDVDSTLLKPSDITARISCQNRGGESLLIDEYKNREIFISLKADEVIENFIFRTNQLHIYEDSKKSRELIYTGDFNYDYLLFNIRKVSASQPGSIDRIDLEVSPSGGETIEINKLNCITIKELSL